MRKQILKRMLIVGVLGMSIYLLPTFIVSPPSYAATIHDCKNTQHLDPQTKECVTDIQPSGLPMASTDPSKIKTILSIVNGIIGALAFLMLVISGLRYVISGGNPERISKAKNGMIYALIGLLIAITAQAIVSFVVGKV